MKRRIYGILFALLLIASLFALASCKKSGEDDPSSEQTPHTHTADADGICTGCNEVVHPTEGVIYELSAGGTYAIVSGYEGTAVRIGIADKYQGVPVTTIAAEAFSENKAITAVIIPHSITTIEDNAFFSCQSLANITVDSDNATYKSVDGSLYSKNGAKLIQYAIGRADTSFAIPNGVTSIGEGAFSYCTSLTDVIIPDSVKTMGDNVFYGCTSLVSVTIGNGVTAIETATFYDCTSLAEVTIPESVTTIDVCAFSNCYSLADVVIPNSVTTICSSAFFGCRSLTELTIPDSVTTIEDNAFLYCTSLVNITVGSNNEAYKSIDGNLYSKDGAKLIQYAIGRADASFALPEGITTIGEWSFAGCTSLTAVTIPDSLTTVGAYAFYGCLGFTDVYYEGSEEKWAEITVLPFNANFEAATVHCDYAPEE